jgi:hypothetical protein
VACPAADLSAAEAAVAGKAGIPVLITQNNGDRIILKTRTATTVAALVAAQVPGAQSPVAVYFSQASADPDNHNAWTRTFEVFNKGTVNNPNVMNTLDKNVYEWLLGFTNTNRALPATWKKLHLLPHPEGVSIHWSVTNEFNVHRYHIERSIDGRHWQPLTSVAASNNGNDMDYHAVDSFPHAGDAFYRIRSHDFDGTHLFSSVKSYRNQQLPAPRAAIFPNPFSNNIIVRFGKQVPARSNLRLFNAAGVLVLQKQINTGDHAVYMDMRHVVAQTEGVYFLVVADEHNKPILTKQLLRQNK